MDRIDEMLAEYFNPASAPADLVRRVGRASTEPAASLETLIDRFHVEATERGVCRLAFGGRRGAAGARSAAARAHVEHARRELREYLGGRRTFFSVPVDLAGIPDFQGKVLAAARRVGFGEVTSYATLARRIGHPRAARAVGNSLGANPVPIIVPCHRIIRGDGTWGHYAFGAALKTRLLVLERRTPVLVGSETTHIVCRRGCSHDRRVREDQRIVFASLDDAASVGYRPCRVCRPASAR